MKTERVVAIYARVSSDQQAKRETVGSQVGALKEKIITDGESFIEEMAFIDEGVSGATLIRPQLERLRDSVALGLIDRLYILAPDRLSRKYAHQVLLMEEFSSYGVEVVFLNHAIGATPEEDLLLQMQGMIAEYERAKIMERNRRGKLHRAKGGSINVLSGAPYGYRYIRKQLDGAPAHYVIDLAEAANVRKIFHWIGVDRLSIGEVTRRLTEAGVKTKRGKAAWDRSVIWGMLQNPAYMGKAAYGKTQATDLVPRVRPQKHSAETPKRPYSVTRTDREGWINIPVPPIVSETLFVAVQEQLEENRKHARQRRRGAAYLLQGLTVCGHCHYAYYGKRVSPATSKGKHRYAYYRCIGTDAYRFGGERICDNPQVRTSKLDELVWTQVLEVLRHPERIEKEYQRRLDILEQDEKLGHNVDTLQKQQRNLEKGKSRLIDSYTNGVIEKNEFEPKIGQLKIKIKQLEEQINSCKQKDSSQFELFLVINQLEEFSKTINHKLETIDFDTKREIIRALVKRVEIYKDEVVIIFRIDPQGELSEDGSSAEIVPTGKIMQDCKRRHIADIGQYIPALRLRP
ncbi:MAG: recombinase family protein, partial [Chromatiales bacterium]